MPMNPAGTLGERRAAWKRSFTYQPEWEPVSPGPVCDPVIGTAFKSETRAGV